MDPFEASVKQPHTVLSIDIDPQIPCTSKSSSQKRNKKTLSNIITIFFKIAYYHGLSPFMIRDDTRTPVISTWWLPKMLWTINLVPCLPLRTAESRLILNDFASDWNPAEYFRVIHAFLKVIFHMNMWYYLWCRSEAYLNIVRFICNSKTLPIPNTKIIVKLLPPCLAVIFSTLGVVLGTNSEAVFMNCFYGSFKNYGKVFRHMSGFYEELLLPTGICVFWLSSREFAKRLSIMQSFHNEVSCQKLWEPAMAWYLSLKELSVLIKNAYGEILFYRLLLLIFDVPITFGMLSNIADQVRFMVMFSATAGVFIFAADAHKQVQTFESCVSKIVDLDVAWISHPRLAMLIHELQSNTVVISLSVGFTITYSLIANASGVLITYFIICVQYRDTSSIKCH